MSQKKVRAEPKILFRDSDLIVLSKPSGVHVFGEPPSVASWLIEQVPEIAQLGDPKKPSIVHRLDKGTSGLLLAACNEQSYRECREQFSENKIEKTYLALVEGRLADTLQIEKQLGARYRRSKKVQVQRPGVNLRGVQPALSRVDTIVSQTDFSLCRVEMKTGVRHQIRAHLADAGHPIANDVLYGAAGSDLGLGESFFLHSWKLKLAHPSESKHVIFDCPLPERLCSILDKLRISVDIF